MARPTYGDVLTAVRNDLTKLMAILISFEMPDGTPITTLAEDILDAVYDPEIGALRFQPPALYGANGTDSITYQGTGTYRGGTIASAGVAQQVMAANPRVEDVDGNVLALGRRKLIFQNTTAPVDDVDMWVTFTGETPAVGVGMRYGAKEGIQAEGTAVEGGAIKVFCATAGASFYAHELP